MCRTYDWIYGKTTGYEICPIYETLSGFESDYARGKILLCKALLDGKLKPDENFIRKIYECTLGGSCAAHCPKPQNLDVPEVIRSARAFIVENDYDAPEEIEGMWRNFEKTGNVLGKEMNLRNRWVDHSIKVAKDTKLLYFPGCFTEFNTPRVAKSTANILNKLEIDFQLPTPEEYCCGYPVLATGREDLAYSVAKKNIKQFKDLGVDQILLSCAGCFHTFKFDYPELIGGLDGVRPIPVVEMLADNVETLKAMVRNDFNPGVVTYHDPCELGRRSGLYEEPRKILKALAGDSFVELRRNRENAMCCGAGGGVLSLGNLALEIARDRIKETEESGAKILVTACPACYWNLRNAVRRLKRSIDVVDITEFVAMSLT